MPRVNSDKDINIMKTLEDDRPAALPDSVKTIFDDQKMFGRETAHFFDASIQQLS